MEGEAEREEIIQQQLQETDSPASTAKSRGKRVNVFQVEYEEGYETVAVEGLDPLNNPSVGKAKYYKQTYRPAWEHMPDFKGEILFHSIISWPVSWATCVEKQLAGSIE